MVIISPIQIVGSVEERLTEKQCRTDKLDPAFNKHVIQSHRNGPCIVFLDPDVGLEPSCPSLGHVLESEALAFWDALKVGDVFVFYQHQTNRNKQPWIETKRVQLAKAIKIRENQLKVARGMAIASDVVFYYSQKT